MGFEFDVSEVAPATGSFELLEPGDYRLEASEISDENVTKDGTGAYVTIKYTVVEGDRQGAQIFANYNIKNKSEKAQEIAWRELSALGHAIGVLAGHSDDLLYKPFSAKVGVEKGKPKGDGTNYNDRNRIEKFYPLDSGAPPAAAQPAPSLAAIPAVVAAKPAPAAKPAAAAGARPWAKRA